MLMSVTKHLPMAVQKTRKPNQLIGAQLAEETHSILAYQPMIVFLQRPAHAIKKALAVLLQQTQLHLGSQWGFQPTTNPPCNYWAPV